MTIHLDSVFKEVTNLKTSMDRLANSMAILAENTARYEERAIADRDRMDRIESNQKDQGSNLTEMTRKLGEYLDEIKRTKWVMVTAVGFFVAGASIAIGFIK